MPKNPRFGSKGFSQVAGPVVKNKLFFFFNYEYNAVGQSATPASPLVPTASGRDALDALTGVNYTAAAAARNYLVPGLDQFNNVRAGKESSRAIHEACKCQRSSSSKCRVRGVQRTPSFRGWTSSTMCEPERSLPEQFTKPASVSEVHLLSVGCEEFSEALRSGR